MNGVVTATVEDKCVDYQVLKKHCSSCKMWEAKENKSGYDLRKANDICNINHTKLHGAMEVGGAIDMFNRSVDKNNLIYHECLGDSDTSSFKKVVDTNPMRNMILFQVNLNE